MRGRTWATISLGIAFAVASTTAGAEDPPRSILFEPEPPAFVEPSFPFLDDEDPRASVSVGDTSHGFLVNAAELVEDPTVGILPRQKARDLAWGTKQIVGLVKHVAAELHDKTGRRLWIGDIAKRGGGDIPWSVSHNSGRDVDIALQYLDRAGAPTDPPDLVRLDHTGQSKDKALRFDAMRTWIVVRAILEYSGAEVQFVFLSIPLKQKLLEYANSHHEPAAIVARAREVVVQPGPPHDDHLHVRIYCPAKDVGGGCVDTGVVHPWARFDHGAREERTRAAVERLEANEASVRRAAVGRLALLDARDHADAVAKRLGDDDADVRATAATAIGTIGGPEHADAVVDAFVRERDPRGRAALLRAASALGGSASGRLIANVIESAPPYCEDLVDRAPEPAPPMSLLASLAPPVQPLLSVPCESRSAHELLLRAAVEAAGTADRLEPVEPLLALLERGEPEMQAKAADALAKITNRRFGVHWGDPEASDPERDIKGWRKWIEMLHKTPRDAWVASGFVAAGYRVPRLDTDHGWELVRALARKDHLAYNAHRVLERITKRKVTWLHWDDAAACGDWLGWIAGHRAVFHLDGPPKTVVDACRAPRD
jgi:penicillin-insensitive murein endopeptidase